VAASNDFRTIVLLSRVECDRFLGASVYGTHPLAGKIICVAPRTSPSEVRPSPQFKVEVSGTRQSGSVYDTRPDHTITRPNPRPHYACTSSILLLRTEAVWRRYARVRSWNGVMGYPRICCACMKHTLQCFFALITGGKADIAQGRVRAKTGHEQMQQLPCAEGRVIRLPRRQARSSTSVLEN